MNREDTENAEKPKRGVKTGGTNECLEVCLSIVGFIALCAVVLIMLIFGLPRIRLITHQAQWNSQDIDSYVITIGGMARLTIRDGQVVEVVDSATQYERDLRNENWYQRYTIEGLFERAVDCTTFCSVQYNVEFGYPERIGGGFLESSYIEVISFQIIDEDDN